MRVTMKLINRPDENGIFTTANGHQYTIDQFNKGMDEYVNTIIKQGRALVYDESIILTGGETKPFMVLGKIERYIPEDFSFRVKLNFKHVLHKIVKESIDKGENRFYVGMIMINEMSEDGKTIMGDQLNIRFINLIDSKMPGYNKVRVKGDIEGDNERFNKEVLNAK